MARMRFENYRAACGKGGSGVATGDRECERKIAGRPDGDGANRDQCTAKIRTTYRFTVRQRRIDANILPLALSHDLGKKAQLVDSAVAFAV
jgi:hypothetical protein